MPNRVAGNLSSRRTTLVALIVPTLRNSLHAEMYQGISDVLVKNGYQLMISGCGNSMELEEQLIGTYVAHQACGVILHNTMHTAKAVRVLKSAGIPVVETGNLAAKPIDMNVSYSNFAAGKAVAQHFASLGYLKAAFVSLPTANRERIKASRKGFLAGMRDAGRPVTPERVLEVGPGMQNGARALDVILKTSPGTRAIFFTGDVLAAGAFFECQRRSIKVPSEMAIAASDDTEWLESTVPAITTIQYPRYQIGMRAAELIIQRTTNAPARAGAREDLGFKIVHRGST